MSGFLNWIGLLGKWPSEGVSDGSSKVSDGPWEVRWDLGIVGWDLQMDLWLSRSAYVTPQFSLVRIIVRRSFLVTLVYLCIVYVSELARMCEHMEVWSL